MNSSKFRGWILYVSVPFLFGAWALASEPKTVDRALTVSGPVTLDVRADPGGIVITTGSSGTVAVHAVIKPLYGRLDFEIAEANILALEKDPPIEQVGNHIRIGYPKDVSVLRAVRFDMRLRYLAKQRCRLILHRVEFASTASPAR
jgi:hypothetical protein